MSLKSILRILLPMQKYTMLISFQKIFKINVPYCTEYINMCIWVQWFWPFLKSTSFMHFLTGVRILSKKILHLFFFSLLRIHIFLSTNCKKFLVRAKIFFLIIGWLWYWKIKLCGVSDMKRYFFKHWNNFLGIYFPSWK